MSSNDIPLSPFAGEAPGLLFGLPMLGFLGFIVAFFNSLWLMASIWRSGKDL